MVLALAGLVLIAIRHGRKQIIQIDDFLTARKSATLSLGIATFIAYAAGAGLLFSPAEAGAAVWGGFPAIIGYGFAFATPFLLYMSVAPKIQERMPHGHSVVEYAKTRYGTLMYGLVLFVALFYMWILMTANLTGVALALDILADVPVLLTLVLVMGATVVYTAYGGLLTSIFTDLVQTILLIPLLVLSIVVLLFQFGGPGAIYSQIQATAPEAVDLTYGPGLEFAIYIIIALLGAEMLNQSLWQRAHAGKDRQTLKLSLLIAAIAVVPIGLLAGIYGTLAWGLDIPFQHPSQPLPAVVGFTFGTVMILAFVVLILLVITSTLDNALSAIVSIFAVDIVPWFNDSIRGDRLLRLSRILTVIVAIVAVGFAATEPSVLGLLLIADWFAAATFVPVLLGLYTPKLRGKAAFGAALVGIVVAGFFFNWSHPAYGMEFNPLGVEQKLLTSFALGLVISTLIALASIILWPGDYDFAELEAIKSMED
jgi:Na+/proline symporter